MTNDEIPMTNQTQSSNDQISSLGHLGMDWSLASSLAFSARPNLNWTDKQNAVVVCASMDMLFFTFPTTGAHARRVVLLALLLLLVCVPARTALAVTVFALRCEQLENPLG